MLSKLFFTMLVIIASIFPGSSFAERRADIDALISGTSPAQNVMVVEAGRLLIRSIQFMEEYDGINKAIGYATAALDIARAAGDKEFVVNTEKLLHVMRTINLMATAELLERQRASIPQLKILACTMARETPQELQGLQRKYLWGSCDSI